MKTFVAATLAAVAAATPAIKVEFMNWITKFGRSYTTMEEFEHRLEQYVMKDALIQYHNMEEEHTYTLGHNNFSDWTQAEYEAILTYKSEGNHPQESMEDRMHSGATYSPIDYRSGSCLNAIKDQGQCGSCWSFSGTASIENKWCEEHGTLYSLSEQQQVDCNTVCYGCNGGWAYQVWNNLRSHYAMSEASYPYTARDGTCQYSSADATPVTVSAGAFSYNNNVTADSPDAMKAALQTNILSVAIQANKYVFQSYSSGIFNNTKCGTSLDHATNVVGWGTSGSTDYWIMRNSWGTSWGENGYMYLEIVSGAGNCGIQMEPNWPSL